LAFLLEGIKHVVDGDSRTDRIVNQPNFPFSIIALKKSKTNLRTFHGIIIGLVSNASSGNVYLSFDLLNSGVREEVMKFFRNGSWQKVKDDVNK